MQNIINFILAILKWPIALLMFILILPLLKADINVLYNGLNLSVIMYFLLPLIVTIIVWLFIPGLSGSFLAILEHEVTHMIFAILTFHSPHNINIKRGVGGNFIYSGRGNWLISIAPYFFPTSAALVIILGLFYPLMNETIPNLYWVILGIMTGFHIISTIEEIHIKQTDFKQAGYVFSLIFLPGANLLTYGFLISYACYGFSGFTLFMDLLRRETVFLFT